jgi:hypothetical protein
MMVSVYLSEVIIFHPSQILNLLKINFNLWKWSYVYERFMQFLGDFNVPGYERVNGFPQAELHYYECKLYL